MNGFGNKVESKSEEGRMKTIRMTVDLTYDQEEMHGNNEYDILWFLNMVIFGNDLRLFETNQYSDVIGQIKVIEIHDDE